MNFLGRKGYRTVFSSDEMCAVVDEMSNTVVEIFPEKDFASREFKSSNIHPGTHIYELANAALTNLNISITASSDRMHTIPKAVVAEAKRGLEWRKEFDRGGTPVGLNTARTLAQGGQIGIKKIRHIAKYFPRHEVDKKGKGYKPGQDGYPSKGRIAWALWGGDAAQRWASAIVERENKKENSSLIASHGYYDFEDPRFVDTRSFSDPDLQFVVRIRMDGSGIDRLYVMKRDGTVLVWDDGCWDTLGHIEHDVEAYDRALDDVYDDVVKIHVPIDPETALVVAGMLDSDPFSPKSLEEVAPEEHALYLAAEPELDYLELGSLIAAPSFETNQDGDYTSEERSQKATAQLRDALGRFAVTGSRVIVGGNPSISGRIISQDEASQMVKVELDDGSFIDVAAKQTQQEDTYEPTVEQGRGGEDAAAAIFGNPIDTSGILGEPRTPAGQVQVPGTLPPLDGNSLQLMLSDFPAWVEGQRQGYLPRPEDGVAPPPTDFGEPDPYYTYPEFDWPKHPNAMNDPLLRDFLEDPKNRGWYTADIRYGDKVEKAKPYSQVYGKGKDRGRTAAALVSAAESDNDYKNPRQSDVAPMYMAIVADDDPQAVMELVALVPKSKTSNEPMTFKRRDARWQKDESILKDLNSATPPPVVMLDNDTLESVIKQIDSPALEAQKEQEARDQSEAPVTAAGGLDRNRGNAERLRRYWKFGPGAAKIRWNTPGDWTRCVRQLSKHMGPRAKGYCALRHKEMTGVWPGDKKNVGKRGRVGSAIPALDPSNLVSGEAIIASAILRGRAEDARKRMVASIGPDVPEMNGSKFHIPLVIPEAMESGDGRIFDKGAITMRDLPLPLLWQIKTGEGHNGSVVVGKITEMRRVDDGIGDAYGYFDSGAFGKEAERLVRGGFIRGVSADLDKFEADEEKADPENGEDSDIKNGRIKIKTARVMAVTLVPKPAFQECQIQIVDEESEQEDTMIPDGVYVEDVDALDASSLVACGMVAGMIPTEPPAEWFENPNLKKATPLTVDEQGRVFGHIAAWHVDHIGMSFGTKPPRSRSKYAYFHTGVIRTAEGKDVPVGQLTLSGGHAALEASAQEAARHYDDTASAFADVHAGEDAYGIWVAGALRPGTTPEQVRAIRASAPSGDWRPIKGHLELVAVCQVNVPGFPIARARVASGQVMALVAAGAQQLARMKSDPIAELNQRLDKLEERNPDPIVAAAIEAKAKFQALRAAAQAQEISARVAAVKAEDLSAVDYMVYGFEDGDPNEELAVITRRMRKSLAKEGKAMPDGSFPIRNANDLRNAVKAYGRAKIGKRAAVKKHIMRRAKALNRENIIPEKWMPRTASGEFADDSNPCWDGYVMVGMKTVDGKEVPNCVPEDAAIAYDVNGEAVDSPKALRERLAEEGKALPDGTYPIVDGSDLRRALWAFKSSPREKREMIKQHIEKRAQDLGLEDMLPEIWKGEGSYFSGEDLVFSMKERASIDKALLASGGIPELSDDEMGIFESIFQGEIVPEDEIMPYEISDIASDPGSDDEPVDYDDDYDDTELATKEEKIVEEIAEDVPATEEEIERLERIVGNQGKDLKVRKKGKYTAETQPRDAQGKFRKVLARLKVDLGTAGASRALEKVEEIENLDFSGDYGKAAKASSDLIDIIDRLDTKALNPESLENVRASSAELGKVIANLPFAFGQDAQKIRFSDMPPTLRDLMEDMIDRVEAKIGKEDADIATKELRSFISGSEVFNQSEISGQMAKLLRLLT
jgi:hypothetical protein